jgi:hypothetical protein
VKAEWVREVTEASATSVVVAFLYLNSMIECQLMEEALRVLAPKFKYIKFVKIKFDQAIENWPERNLPTLFIYKDGVLANQLLTLNSVGGKKMTAAGTLIF